MNKLMKVVGAVGVAVVGLAITGCGHDNTNPVAQWQKDRFMAQQISAVYDAKRPLQVSDVTYKSKQEGKFVALGIPFNALAPVTAALYFKVVQGVDALDSELSGIELVRELNMKTCKDADPKMTPEQVFADWAEKGKEDSTYANAKDRYDKCVQAIANSKTDVLIPMIQDIVAVQIPKALGDVQKTLEQVTADFKSGKIKIDGTVFETAGALKVIAEDGAELSKQLAQTGVGAKHWLALAIEARDLRKAFAEMDNVK